MFKLIVLLEEVMRNRSLWHQYFIHVNNILNREVTSDCLPFQKGRLERKKLLLLCSPVLILTKETDHRNKFLTPIIINKH